MKNTTCNVPRGSTMTVLYLILFLLCLWEIYPCF